MLMYLNLPLLPVRRGTFESLWANYAGDRNGHINRPVVFHLEQSLIYPAPRSRLSPQIGIADSRMYQNNIGLITFL
jgi:hypothetical protein